MFYVYVHRRADTGAPFYVGKGTGARLRVKQHRSNWWRGIVASAGGYESAIIVRDADEELIFLAEIEAIDVLRRRGAGLCNLTDGGEGMAGHRWDAESLKRRADAQRGQLRPSVSEKLRGVPKSAEHRANISAARLGLKASDAVRRQMSEQRRVRGLVNRCCPRCGYVGNLMTVARWHGENCKG